MSFTQKDPSTKTALGRAAETLVVEYLEARGMLVVDRNVRLGALELDIVALDGRVVVVVEVRMRSARSFTTPLMSLSARKLRRLRWAGERLWRRRYRNDSEIDRLRFDVAAVTFDGTTPVVEYVRCAFC